MAPHSSTRAWKIPWTEEPGRLQSMGSLRVGHDSVTSLSLFTFVHWRRKWQPTPVFLLGESQGRRSLVDCCLWGRAESDTTEATWQQQQQQQQSVSWHKTATLASTTSVFLQMGEEKKEKSYPVQYCGLENSMDCIVHGVKSQTGLSNFHQIR